MEIFNLILLLFFAGACVWLIRILLRLKKAIQIYCCFWTASRIMILIAASLCFLPFLAMDFSPMTVLRSVLMAVVIIMFALISDGLGSDGFMYMGSAVPFDAITEYDVKEVKNKCKVVMTVKEVDKKGKTSLTQLTFDFKKEQKDEVANRLKVAIGKKYRRMKLER